MIFFTAFLLATVSCQLIHAEDAAAHRTLRAPQQSRVNYRTPDGYKINDKSYPGTQWKSHEQGRNSRQEPQAGPRLKPTPQKQTEESFYQYKPFSAVPEHIKQIINQVYTPQVPYVNPYAFFYNINPTQTVAQDNSEAKSQEYLPPQESSSQKFAESSSIRHPSYTTPTNVNTNNHNNNQQTGTDYRTNYPTHTIASFKKTPKAGIKYKNDERSNQHFGSRSSLYSSRQDQGKRSLENDFGNYNQESSSQGYQKMPPEIQQLLQFQAQIPYNVLANQILFEFKKPFVPQPLPNDIKYSGHYPNKVYYVQPDGQIVDDPPVRQISEEQSYKY